MMNNKLIDLINKFSNHSFSRILDQDSLAVALIGSKQEELDHIYQTIKSDLGDDYASSFEYAALSRSLSNIKSIAKKTKRQEDKANGAELDLIINMSFISLYMKDYLRQLKSNFEE